MPIYISIGYRYRRTLSKINFFRVFYDLIEVLILVHFVVSWVQNVSKCVFVNQGHYNLFLSIVLVGTRLYLRVLNRV